MALPMAFQMAFQIYLKHILVFKKNIMCRRDLSRLYDISYIESVGHIPRLPLFKRGSHQSPLSPYQGDIPGFEGGKPFAVAVFYDVGVDSGKGVFAVEGAVPDGVAFSIVIDQLSPTVVNPRSEDGDIGGVEEAPAVVDVVGVGGEDIGEEEAFVDASDGKDRRVGTPGSMGEVNGDLGVVLPGGDDDAHTGGAIDGIFGGPLDGPLIGVETEVDGEGFIGLEDGISR